MSRGKPKRTLHDLSREWPTHEELRAVSNAVATHQSPIVTAILGAAMVEQQLERMLRPRFEKQDDETWKVITEIKGPLSDFYSKIVAGYGFGLYDEAFAKNLHLLRTIRNTFAHSKKLITFGHELVRKELGTITLPPKKRSMLYRSLSAAKTTITESPAVSFIILCLALDNELLRKDTRRLKRLNRRLAKRRLPEPHNPFRGALASIFEQGDTMPRQGLLGALLAAQNQDSTSQSDEPSPEDHPPKDSTSSRKADR